MSIYESVEKYSKELNMSMDLAKVRLDYFTKVKKEMKETRKCPKCNQYSLELESGEWECGISDWIYCANDEIETKDSCGDFFHEYCDFTDDVHNKYLFAFEHDFDAVLMMSCSIDINDEKEVFGYIGSSWDDFVKKDTFDLILKK